MRIHVGMFLENHAGDFQLDDLRFVVAERRENFVAVRAKLRCRLRWQRRAIELDRHADHVEAAHAVVDDALHETIGLNRSEEHTSELQSLMRNSYAVFCLNKKNINYTIRLSTKHHH